MTGAQWAFILALAGAAFGIRLLGLLAGARLQRSRFAPLLAELPGLIVVSLVASALAGKPPVTWVAAAIALAVAVLSDNVIVTMVVGVIAFAGLLQSGLF